MQIELYIITQLFKFCRRQNPPPLVYRAKDDKFQYLSVEKNHVMGAMDELAFEGQNLTLEPGDRLFLYTDGVTEALSVAKELYGEERLLDCLNHAEERKGTLQELLAAVRKSLDAHVGEAEQSDDITTMALVYHGPKHTA